MAGLDVNIRRRYQTSFDQVYFPNLIIFDLAPVQQVNVFHVILEVKRYGDMSNKRI